MLPVGFVDRVDEHAQQLCVEPAVVEAAYISAVRLVHTQATTLRRRFRAALR
jgi:hypothetical protein